MARNIAFFAGAETGGLEEARSSGSGHSASTANASMLGKDSYHYRITGNGGINMRFELFADGRPTDQGNGYLFSFDIEWTALPSAQAEFFHIYEAGVSTQACCELQHNADNSLSLLNANNTVLSTSSVMVVDTKYRIEIYFEHSASAAWEWWINGTSVGSGTGADMTDGGTLTDFFFETNATQTYDLNNIVVQTGCAKTDRLGAGVEVIAYASDGGTPTEGGDTLASGAMINTQEVPLTTDLAQFTDGPKSRWIQADGTHTVLGPGPSGDGLTKIIAAKVVAQPAP